LGREEGGGVDDSLAILQTTVHRLAAMAV